MELPYELGQYLKSLGIKVKHLKPDTERKSSSGLVFGNSLCVLPQCTLPDGSGTIPRFLMEACSYLSQHLETEGIFRKSGSLLRMKNLKVKLQRGDCSLDFSSASDIAGLLKQFFRELPDPIVPTGLHSPLCQAQQLESEVERSDVTILLTCLMPKDNVATLKYFLSFLQTVAGRSEENKMGIRNLAVVFTPNLFQLLKVNGKLSGSVEKSLPLLTQAAETLITQARKIGQLPQLVLDQLPVLVGAGAGPPLVSTDPGEQRLTVKQRKKGAHRVGGIMSGALNRLKTSMTPQVGRSTVTQQQEGSTGVDTMLTSKRKIADDSAGDRGIMLKKRRSGSDSTGTESAAHSDGDGPGLAGVTPADCRQDGLPGPPQSISVFPKPLKERDILSAGGRETPSTPSVSRTRNRKAASTQKQRMPFANAATPHTVVRKSSHCLGFNGNKDSKINLLSDLASVENCDWMTQTLGGAVNGSRLPEANVPLTPGSQGSDHQDNGLLCQTELEDHAPRQLLPGLSLGALCGAELSKDEAAFPQDAPGSITRPPDPSLKFENTPGKGIVPNIADSPAHDLSPEVVEKDQPWKGCHVFGFPGDSGVSVPFYPQCHSVPNCKVVRRSLSLPEAISGSWEEGDEEVETAAISDIQLMAMESFLPAASTESSQTFNRRHAQQPGSCARTHHPCTASDGFVDGMFAGSKVPCGLAMPIIGLVEQDPMESCASSTDGRVRSAQSYSSVPSDPVGYTGERPNPQPRVMEMARSSVAEYIRKLNKLSAKRGSSKHKFPLSSKQTPQSWCLLRFTQQASSLFGRKSERQQCQDSRHPMRRSLSLESVWHICKDLDELKDNQ
ncbi:uncharacterized protein [Narcine bancroftii]|uniref:uncharacterized protein isoform X2 n=1 Tax=Narcine bancroftii TaxID=1343680 RepID=UPI003831A711